jgi:hypothetical protein
MKKILLIAVALTALSLLIVGFAIPVFAHGPEDQEGSPILQGEWDAMHEACEDGDWETMAEAAEQLHGDDFESMPCHGDFTGDYSHWDGMQDHMGWGMMGWR